MSRHSILAADDDAVLGTLLRSQLNALGFEPNVVRHGQAAIEAFQASPPDLILLDVIMPEMDGFEACAAIRRLPGGSDIPILMMTGLEDVAAIQRAFESGATDFITKPINFVLLGHRIQYLLRSHETLSELRRSERRLTSAHRIARVGDWEWTSGEDTVEMSGEARAFFELPTLGPNPSYPALIEKIVQEDIALIRESFQQAVLSGGPVRGEFRIRSESEDVRVVYVEGQPAQDARGRPKLVGVVQDISERRRAERQVVELSYFDSLTGLPNRKYLEEKLRGYLETNSEESIDFALLSLDVDLFNRVNESLGREAGDTLLRQVGQRVDAAVRSTQPDAEEEQTGEILVRAGGDEFMLLLSGPRSERAAEIASAIQRELSRPFKLFGQDLFISTTIGIATKDGEFNPERLMSNADIAMTFAKRKERGGTQFYSEAVHRARRSRLELENALHRAVERRDFELHYQPKVDGRTGRVAGVEALIRWNDPVHGRVSPGIFIPIAEENGLIVQIGEWVLERGCLQAAKWASDPAMPRLSMAINIGASHFVRADFVRSVESALGKSGLDPSLLEIEITETTLMGDQRVIDEGLSKLRDLGVSIALDDFGTGYSSLGYLKRFPLSVVKIDRSFVKDVTTSNESAAIATAVLNLSKGLGLEVVAEGVETPDQLSFFRSLGCDFMQGFAFCRPVNAVDFESYLSAWDEHPMREHFESVPLRTRSAG